VLTCRKSYSVR